MDIFFEFKCLELMSNREKESLSNCCKVYKGRMAQNNATSQCSKCISKPCVRTCLGKHLSRSNIGSSEITFTSKEIATIVHNT